MGEYAKLKRTGESVKLGTCECMYYCTIKQRHQVEGYEFNRNQMTLWRLPLVPAMTSSIDKYGRETYKVEKAATEAGDGNPEDWRHYDATLIYGDAFWANVEQTCPESIDANVGSLQITHPSGLELKVPCLHGKTLPEVTTKGWNVYWNGRERNQMRIHWIMTKGDEVSIIVSCQYCGKSWEVSIEELETMMKFPTCVVVDKEKHEWDKRRYGNQYRFSLAGEALFNAIKEEIADWMADSPKTPKQEQKREYVFGNTIMSNSKIK